MTTHCDPIGKFQLRWGVPRLNLFGGSKHFCIQPFVRTVYVHNCLNNRFHPIATSVFSICSIFLAAATAMAGLSCEFLCLLGRRSVSPLLKKVGCLYFILFSQTECPQLRGSNGEGGGFVVGFAASHSECSCPQWRPTRNKRTLKMDSQPRTLVEMPTCSPPCSSRRTPRAPAVVLHSCDARQGWVRVWSKVEDGIATMLSSDLRFWCRQKKDSIEQLYINNMKHR